ncbi:hypothetical protein Ahy_A03g011974 isoform B [Arachis hypogaea]|uniref:Uncharacterized protein n=1 Tax=Arachis hypogaea TaxID=3818 RepID=A0A445DSC7_ARAHY|nr:hypothetical protein Ahy_A03g011974 isoform B [Arachis hypogaea]
MICQHNPVSSPLSRCPPIPSIQLLPPFPLSFAALLPLRSSLSLGLETLQAYHITGSRPKLGPILST